MGSRRRSCGWIIFLLRLTLVGPDNMEAILNGRQTEGMQLDDLLKGFPLDWTLQNECFAISGPHRQE